MCVCGGGKHRMEPWRKRSHHWSPAFPSNLLPPGLLPPPAPSTHCLSSSQPWPLPPSITTHWLSPQIIHFSPSAHYYLSPGHVRQQPLWSPHPDSSHPLSAALFFFKKYLFWTSLWVSGKESTCQCRRRGFDPWSRKIPHAAGQISPWTTTTKPVL